jgi:hypothetical protein
MLAIYLWIYTFILALLWWLFIVAKIHAYKFSNFSLNIIKVTNFLLIFLIILSILWYILIIFSTSNTTVVDNYSSSSINEVNY